MVRVENGEVGRQEHAPHEQRGGDRGKDIATFLEILREIPGQVAVYCAHQHHQNVDGQWRDETFKIHVTC